MANELTPHHFPGDTVSAEASGAVTGKTAVGIAAARTTDGNYVVSTAASAEDFFGVAAFDTADGELLTVFRKGIVPITAGAAITAGDALALDASGQVTPQAAPAAGSSIQTIGHAVDDAANGADCLVDLRPATISTA